MVANRGLSRRGRPGVDTVPLEVAMLLLLLACATVPTDKPESDDSAAVSDDSGAPDDTGTPASTRSAGCGLPTSLPPGGLQQTVDAGVAGDGERGYWLSLPEGYDPEQAYALVLGYPGTNWLGEDIAPYLDLEQHSAGDTIFAYPDPLWRDFEGWGNYGGWLLGPHANPAQGDQDLVFTAALLDRLEAELCIDTDRIHVTGHSWGGDMAAVVGCFLGDRVAKTAPVAANRPYWFEPAGGGDFDCVGSAAVWTFFGEDDTHFTWQDYPGQYGEEQDAFWATEHACAEEVDTLDHVGLGDCIAHTGCAAETRYCLYPPDSGHQRPDAFPAAVMRWFAQF
jgi:polyhydroxybutyrate depolymerase